MHRSFSRCRSIRMTISGICSSNLLTGWMKPDFGPLRFHRRFVYRGDMAVARAKPWIDHDLQRVRRQAIGFMGEPLGIEGTAQLIGIAEALATAEFGLEGVVRNRA